MKWATIEVWRTRPERRFWPARWEASVVIHGQDDDGLRHIEIEVGIGFGPGCAVSNYVAWTPERARAKAEAAAREALGLVEPRAHLAVTTIGKRP